MIAWDQVPRGHRCRCYEYVGALVRCRCQCRWLSTAARTVDDARALWAAHIRSLVKGTR